VWHKGVGTPGNMVVILRNALLLDTSRHGWLGRTAHSPQQSCCGAAPCGPTPIHTLPICGTVAQTLQGTSEQARLRIAWQALTQHTGERAPLFFHTFLGDRWSHNIDNSVRRNFHFGLFRWIQRFCVLFHPTKRGIFAFCFIRLPYFDLVE